LRNALRVLAAHDHALMRRAIEIALAGDERVTLVGVVAGPAATVAACERERPDIVLVDDLLLRRGAGILPDAIAATGAAIVVFAGSEGPVPACASGTIPKTIHPAELGVAIHRLAPVRAAGRPTSSALPTLSAEMCRRPREERDLEGLGEATVA
jgi:DNA-binding NarL/FixJ family response regulator